MDLICTISDQCVRSLKEVFPEEAEKVRLVPNISLPSMITRLAEEPIDMPSVHGFIFATIGQVSYNKGIDMIIAASRILKQNGIDFSWLLVGSIATAEGYVDEVMQSDLKNNIYFMGVQSNPYPFMKCADIIVHPSRFEGKSVTLDESKILCKPIVVTNFTTVGDQFENEVNASICEMTGEAVAQTILKLIENKEWRDRYITNLKDELVLNPEFTFIKEIFD